MKNMSKLLGVNEIKKDFTTNINQSDKFENTKGIMQNFKNFCNNNKGVIAGIGVPIAILLIQMGVTTYQSAENDKKQDLEMKEHHEAYLKTTNESWDSIMSDDIAISAKKEVENFSKMTDNEKADYTEKKKVAMDGLNPKHSEIYYDFSAIDGVTEKASNNDEKATRLNKLKI